MMGDTRHETAPGDSSKLLGERCSEGTNITRRGVLGITAGLFSWAYSTPFSYAAGAADPRLLVVVLRGGMDGLNVCIPFGDPHYLSSRGGIAIPAASTLKLDTFFGLHPALKNFHTLYKNKEAAVVHAVAIPLRSRSHFDAQDNLENGMPGVIASSATGWLNRLLSSMPVGDPVRLAGGIQIGEAPLIMRGAAPVLGWSASGFPEVPDPTLSLMRSLYQDRDAELYNALENGLRSNNLAAPLDQNDGDISTLRKSFRGAARLFAADGGPRIAVISLGGFDTHAKQGTTQGVLADLLTEIDIAIAEFKVHSSTAWNRTAIVLATEFGRNVRINGDEGTDHGVGTVALLAGGAVKGGKTVCDWPGLAPAQLYEDVDLRPTLDMRGLFKGILRDHLGLSAATLGSSIFPDSAAINPIPNLIKTVAETRRVSSQSRIEMRRTSPIEKYRSQLTAQ